MSEAGHDVSEDPILDQDAIDRMKEWGGSVLVDKMIRLFLDNTGDKMTRIQSGISDRRFEDSLQGAHSLKSSAGNLGAQRLSRLAARIEASSDTGDVEALVTLLPKILIAYDLTCAELETIAEGLQE